MAISTSFEVIFLGTLPLIDTTQGNDEVENAAGILGSYGSGFDPLYNNIHTLSAERLSEDANDTYDTDNGGGFDSFRINGGAPQDFDAGATYNAVITYADGTTASITAVVFQDVSGNTYLVPNETDSSDQAALTAAPIQSLSLNSVASALGDMKGARVAGDLKTVVDGTTGDDNMSLGSGYADAEGDVITTGDDYIVAGDGNDMINGGSGNDTIYGGAGNDLIDDWDGNDLVYAGDGADTVDLSVGQDTIFMEGGDDLVNVWDNAGYNSLDGGTGTDTLDFRNWQSTDGVTVDIASDGSGIFTHFAGATTGIFTDFEIISGTAYSDTLDASDNTTGIVLYGEAGADLITGGFGDDVIDGGSGTNTVIGGAGSDTLLSSGNNDSVFGGDGADVIVISAFESGGVNNLYVDGGSGGDDYDTLDISALIADGWSIVSMTQNSETAGTPGFSGQIQLSRGSETANINYVDIENLITVQQNYMVEGTAGADLIDAGYTRDPDGDMVDAADNETGTDADLILAGQGDDTVFAGFGDDTVYGETGNDVLSAGLGNDILAGGSGNDSLTGGEGNDLFIYSSGSDTITDFNIGNSGALNDGDPNTNDFIDLSGYYDHLFELWADQADDGVLNQSNVVDTQGNAVDYADNLQFAAGDGITFTGATADSTFFTVENTGVVCFAKGTMIRTVHGEVPVEKLLLGDRVITRDNGPKPIIWIGSRHVSVRELEQNPKLKPIHVAPDLIGADAPLIVSPQHGLLLRNIDGEEALIRATHLARLRGGKARVMRGCRQITYHHLMFEAHQIIFANGAPVESFYPGCHALWALSPSARAEITALFPALLGGGHDKSYGQTARNFATLRHLPVHLGALARVGT